MISFDRKIILEQNYKKDWTDTVHLKIIWYIP
jgi:hypothetical protein